MSLLEQCISVILGGTVGGLLVVIPRFFRYKRRLCEMYHREHWHIPRDSRYMGERKCDECGRRFKV